VGIKDKITLFSNHYRLNCYALRMMHDHTMSPPRIVSSTFLYRTTKLSHSKFNLI